MAETLDELKRALGLMENALEMLDAADTAYEVGAHLDLAIQRLKVLVAQAT